MQPRAHVRCPLRSGRPVDAEPTDSKYPNPSTSLPSIYRTANPSASTSNDVCPARVPSPEAALGVIDGNNWFARRAQMERRARMRNSNLLSGWPRAGDTL